MLALVSPPTLQDQHVRAPSGLQRRPHVPKQGCLQCHREIDSTKAASNQPQTPDRLHMCTLGCGPAEFVQVMRTLNDV